MTDKAMTAEEIVAKAWANKMCSTDTIAAINAATAEAERRGYERGLEEAAREVESLEEHSPQYQYTYFIRALKEKP